MQINPAGVVGELCIAGKNVCGEYLNRSDLNERHFVPNPFIKHTPQQEEPIEMLYRTGDLAVRLADGDVLFVGRRDDQVKINGYRIELQEVQTVVEAHPEVAAAAVVVHDDRLCAYVVPASVDETELRRYISARVAHYMVPWAIMVLDAMPLNKNGKLDRAALPRPQRNSGRDGDRLPLITETQWRVADVWRSVLSLPGDRTLHRSDNFFDIGGSSLKAAIMVQHLSKAGVGGGVSVRLLFENQTIAELADALDERKGEVVMEKYSEVLAQEEGEAFTADETPMSPLRYGVLQALLVLLLLTITIAPQILLVLSFYHVVREFEVYIAMCILPGCLMGSAVVGGLFIVAAKWLVVGRLVPGQYPFAGKTYLRWWFNGKLGVTAATWLWALDETPLLPAWHRLLGATVGSRAHVNQAMLFEPDLVTLGDWFVGDFECAVSTSMVIDRKLVLRRVVVGHMVRLGVRSVVLPGTRAPDGVDITHSSVVSSRACMRAGERWSGSLAKCTGRAAFTTQQVGMCNDRCLNQSQTFEIGSTAQKRAAGVAPITSIIR